MTSPSASTELQSNAARVLPSGVTIEGIALRDLRYIEDAGPNSDETFDELWPEPGLITFSGSIIVVSHVNAEFSMNIRARLTVGDAVFGIEAAFSAMFSRSEIIEAGAFVSFINRQGAPLLFPYFRELVSSVSARSIYTPVNLAPLIITPLVDEATVKDQITNLETLIAEAGEQEQAEAAVE